MNSQVQYMKQKWENYSKKYNIHERGSLEIFLNSLNICSFVCKHITPIVSHAYLYPSLYREDLGTLGH